MVLDFVLLIRLFTDDLDAIVLVMAMEMTTLLLLTISMKNVEYFSRVEHGCGYFEYHNQTHKMWVTDH